MYHNLTNEEKMLVNSEVANNKKSMGVAYLLWFFLSSIGIHRFYLNHKTSGLAMLALNVIGWLTTFLFIGFFFLAILGVWVLVDVFLVSTMVKGENERLVESYSQKVLASRTTVA